MMSTICSATASGPRPWSSPWDPPTEAGSFMSLQMRKPPMHADLHRNGVVVARPAAATRYH